jgi:WD40 repeat protein
MGATNKSGFQPLEWGEPSGGTAPKEEPPPYEHAIFGEHNSTVYDVAYSPDGKFFATADTAGKRTLLWDTGTRQLIREFKAEGHGRIFGISISPDGKLLATADYDKKAAYTWDLQTGALLTTFSPDVQNSQGQPDGHKAGVWPITFSPDSKRLLTGAWDSTAKIWDADTGRLYCTLKGHQGRLMGVAWCPDGCQVATASFDSTVRTWQADSGDPLHIYHTNETGEGLSCVEVRPFPFPPVPELYLHTLWADLGWAAAPVLPRWDHAHCGWRKRVRGAIQR